VTGQKATQENIAQLNPDIILAATGSHAVLPNIPGLYDENGRQYASVMTGDELLEDLHRLESIRESGKKTAILGGGLIGTEVADLLCSYGVSVELFEWKDRIAEELNKGRRVFVMKRLKEGQARIHTQAKITHVSLPDVFVEINGKEERFSDFGAVIVALGRTNSPSFAQQLKEAFPEKQIIALGDADVPGMAMAAITQAAVTAAEL
jgi:pyruvate/2-oxoglutarate dehydrogenase complex dihydrolipoamide dehydrogenase (E3) component